MTESLTNNQPKNQFDENGLRVGYWEETYDFWSNSLHKSRSIFSKGYYVNNKRRGYWESIIHYEEDRNEKRLIYYL